MKRGLTHLPEQIKHELDHLVPRLGGMTQNSLVHTFFILNSSC